MKRTEVWQSSGGAIEKSLDRAVAHEIHEILPKSATGGKVLDWSACLRIVENAHLIMPILTDLTEVWSAPATLKPSAD